MNGVADTASDETSNHSPKTRRCGDKIGQSDKMNEPRQSEILLGDIEMRRRGLAKARRKASFAGHDQRRGGDCRHAQRKRPRRGPRRPAAEPNRRDDPHREHELPSEGIEEPAAGLRPIRQIEVESARGRVEARGDDEGEQGIAQRHGDRHGGPQHEDDIKRQDVEISQLMAEQREAQEPVGGRAEDERSSVGFDQVRNAAQPVGGGEHDERGERQRDVHAVNLERALEAGAGGRRESVFARSRQIDEANRQAGQEDKRLRAVRKPEIPRSKMFQRVAGNVIHEDHDQHGPAPKIDVANTVHGRQWTASAQERRCPQAGSHVRVTEALLTSF